MRCLTRPLYGGDRRSCLNACANGTYPVSNSDLAVSVNDDGFTYMDVSRRHRGPAPGRRETKPASSAWAPFGGPKPILEVSSPTIKTLGSPLWKA